MVRESSVFSFEQVGRNKTTTKRKSENRGLSVPKIKDRDHYSPFLPTPSPEMTGLVFVLDSWVLTYERDPVRFPSYGFIGVIRVITETHPELQTP